MKIFNLSKHGSITINPESDKNWFRVDVRLENGALMSYKNCKLTEKIIENENEVVFKLKIVYQR